VTGLPSLNRDYDAWGPLISDPFGDTTRFVYDGAGRRLQKLGTQGLRTEYGYDPGTGWLTGVTSYTDTNAIASAFAYPTHDDVGNRLAMSETSGASTSYGYDALDRLASVDPPDEALFPANGAETWFAYDGSGNRTDFGPQSSPGSFISPHTTYTYGPLKRLTNIKLDGATVESFSYDVNGNAVTWSPPGAAYPRALGYDALGRMVSISVGYSASYAYDPFGRRIEKTEQGVTTRTQYDGLDVVAEYSETALTATYVFGPGIDEVLKLRRGTTVAAYHTDGLGSVVAISEGGTLKNTYRYDAFGKPIEQGGSAPVSNAYTYTGRELDGSGLYYYRARYYLPSAGRFLTPDPIGLAGGINAYAYVGSNPVNYTDPFGLMAGRALGPASPDAPPAFLAGRDPYNLWGTRNSIFGELPQTDWLNIASEVGKGVGLVALGFVPGIADGMDVYDVVRPDASGWERALGGLSLAGNFLTAGLAPNAGPILRGIDHIDDVIESVGRAGRTLPNGALGWHVGDPINNLTAAGNVPSWSAVRSRIWKNEAFYNSPVYDEVNLARMRLGLAPQRINPLTGSLESMQLHHIPPQREGGLFDVIKLWPDEHKLVDPFAR
jgi:RHS repeat-associated protein